MKDNHTFFKNEECPYYPCHKTDCDDFNCLFCFCPLYALGDRCGGNFVYSEDGVKDCSKCVIPHSENGYSYILSKLPEVSKIAKGDGNQK